MTNAEQLRQLGGLLRRYYAPEFREPLSEDILRLATSLEARLRAIEFAQVHARAAEAPMIQVMLFIADLLGGARGGLPGRSEEGTTVLATQPARAPWNTVLLTVVAGKNMVTKWSI